jgi:hypothetical protein
MRTLLLPVLPVLVLAACGRSAPGPAAAPAASPAAGPAAPAGAGWATMDRKQRLEHMGIHVLPAMKQAFRQHDATAFADFRCQTCHGDGFDQPDVDFRMPRDLPPLAAADPVAGGMAYDPETTRFMVETVVPTMARLLDEEPFDPATGKGFGCFRCHPRAE